MFKKKVKEEPKEMFGVQPEELFHGYGVTTDIESKLIEGSWETVGRILIKRSRDLSEWEQYNDAVKSISKDYNQSLLTVLQALNAIINKANENPSMFKLVTDELSAESPSQ